MFTLFEPTAELIESLVSEYGQQKPSYEPVGMLKSPCPTGWAEDHNRCKLGDGQAVFDSAVEAIHGWKQFDLGWVEQVRSSELAPIKLGSVAAVVAKSFGLWSVNLAVVCDIVDEETDDYKRWGFSYATLPCHIERGEEQFLIEWNKSDNSVHYDVRAYSRPNHFLVWLGYPVSRAMQRKFGRDTRARMQQAVSAY